MQLHGRLVSVVSSDEFPIIAQSLHIQHSQGPMRLHKRINFPQKSILDISLPATLRANTCPAECEKRKCTRLSSFRSSCSSKMVRGREVIASCTGGLVETTSALPAGTGTDTTPASLPPPPPLPSTKISGTLVVFVGRSGARTHSVERKR
jgi:hypothetical protein